MSEPSPTPDEPDRDRNLESLLKKLEPTPLDRGLTDSVLRRYRLERSANAYDPHRPRWRQVIPLTLAGVIAMAAYASFRFQTEVRPAKETPEMAAMKIASDPTGASVAAVPSVSPNDSFVPVSAQGFLVNTSSGGVVETEEGPQERMNLEFRDAYHWHDPETGTNLRFFQPRSEEIMVPLRTD